MALNLLTSFWQAGAPATTPQPQTDAWWMTRHKQKLLQLRQGKTDLLFIGDSITQGWEDTGLRVWDQYYASRGAVNLGFNSDRTEHVLWRLAHGEIDDIAPRLVILLIGTNNRTARPESPTETSAGIQAIVDVLRARLPNTKILLLALFPRGASPQDSLRRHHTRVNAHLRGQADGRSIVFLDLGERFVDNQGRLRQHLMPDQVHPSEAGYRTWAEGMEPIVQTLLGVSAPPVDMRPNP
ncbi:hypothetical protein YTPLAS18_38310 [Nitrospira sp.]|nr:hypothetical protein YTPLAS18_38310 [Nitrospira sp.]